MTLTTSLLRRCAATVVATALAFGAAHVATAAEYTMKLSTPTINDLQHEWMKRYKEELEKRSDGRIEVQLYPASQLGPISSVLEGLQLGTVEGTISPSELYAGVDSRFQVPAIPHLFSSMQDARNRLDDPKVRDYLLNIATDKGIKGITVLVYGPQMLNTRKEVTSLDDLAGQRIRVLASETEIGTVNALGASAVPMPLTEVSASLQQGVIDGYSTVLDVFNSLGTSSVAPYVAKTELWYLISVGSVSTVWFESLPADLQKLVLDTAKDLEQPMFERQLERMEANAADWREAGGTIHELSDADMKTARNAADQVAEDFVADHPEMSELYDRIQAAD